MSIICSCYVGEEGGRRRMRGVETSEMLSIPFTKALRLLRLERLESQASVEIVLQRSHPLRIPTDVNSSCQEDRTNSYMTPVCHSTRREFL